MKEIAIIWATEHFAAGTAIHEGTEVSVYRSAAKCWGFEDSLEEIQPLKNIDTLAKLEAAFEIFRLGAARDAYQASLVIGADASTVRSRDARSLEDLLMEGQITQDEYDAARTPVVSKGIIVPATTTKVKK